MTMYYIICSCPRSGSSLLSEALITMGAGHPEEFFNPVTMRGTALSDRSAFLEPTPDDYTQRIKQEYTRNGIFGMKTHYTHIARAADVISRMEYFFPNARYISITRRNILRQAISAARATQTHAWTSQLPQQQKPRFSYFSILKHLFLTAQEIELWEHFYATRGITPLRILYEDLDEDYEGTMRKVVDFLGLKGDIPPPPMKKQADALTEAWLERISNLFRNETGISRLLRYLARRW